MHSNCRVKMRASLVPAALRYLDQVARSGSIQKAAKELNVSASAIDRQILMLEQDFNVKLFERLHCGMRPDKINRHTGRLQRLAPKMLDCSGNVLRERVGLPALLGV